MAIHAHLNTLFDTKVIKILDHYTWSSLNWVDMPTKHLLLHCSPLTYFFPLYYLRWNKGRSMTWNTIRGDVIVICLGFAIVTFEKKI